MEFSLSYNTVHTLVYTININNLQEILDYRHLYPCTYLGTKRLSLIYTSQLKVKRKIKDMKASNTMLHKIHQKFLLKT
jgi:hypothetical protein